MSLNRNQKCSLLKLPRLVQSTGHLCYCAVRHCMAPGRIQTEKAICIERQFFSQIIFHCPARVRSQILKLLDFINFHPAGFLISNKQLGYTRLESPTSTAQVVHDITKNAWRTDFGNSKLNSGKQSERKLENIVLWISADQRTGRNELNQGSASFSSLLWASCSDLAGRKVPW